MADIAYATIEDDAESAPVDQQCIWLGCTRRRAPGRASGSGRQKEYCLKANRPENGGGPVHNARNRWAQREREEAAGTVARLPTADDGQVPPPRPVTTAKQRAGELLEQARRQHASTLASLEVERELYALAGEQFRVMSDPASLDLEIAAIGLKAGRDISAAGEEVARAQRGRLDAERERDEAVRLKDEADAAAEQFAEDTEAAERALAERAAEFERERDELLARVLQAGQHADRVRAEAEEVKAAAARQAENAGRQAEEAARQAENAGRRAEEAGRQAQDAIRQARERVSAAEARADTQIEQARQQAAAAAADARREIAAARGEAEAARADAEAMRAGIARAEREAAAADARAAAVQAGIERLREGHAKELARLEAAHREAIGAERARAERAEATLDALRAAGLAFPGHAG
ncbi:MAG TPA: hypothetical protein VF482_13725 [Trebonia sp.]